jgi:membrane protease YdiL (CAAX protease family)
MLSPFLRLRARYLLLWLLVSSVVAVVVVSPPLVPASSPEPLEEGLLMWTIYGLLVVLTFAQARLAGLRPASFFHPAASPRELTRLSTLAIPLVGLAFIYTYAVFAPLSLVWPDFVQLWLLEDVPVLYDPRVSAAANIVGVTAATLAAPVAEEWFFRGLLLRRWAEKWSVTTGVVGSSLVFAVLHADVLGAFLFGVAMCALYARYRSLWPSIVVHAANNGLVVILVVLDAHSDLVLQAATVEQFRAGWWAVLIGIVMAAPWLGWIMRPRRITIATWQFDRDAGHAMMQPPG